jgi:hypothetical protein
MLTLIGVAPNRTVTRTYTAVEVIDVATKRRAPRGESIVANNSSKIGREALTRRR